MFGSHARGEATAESDLDLLVETERPVGWEFFSCARDLEEQSGIKVDVGPGVSDYMMRYIKKDLMTLYEVEQRTAA